MAGQRLLAMLALLGSACFEPSFRADLTCGADGGCPRGRHCETITNTCVSDDQALVAALVLESWPATVEAGIDAPPLVGRLVDASGNTVAVSGGAFGVEVLPDSLATVEPLAVPAVGGIVSLSGLSFARPRRGLQLRLVGGGLSASTGLFDVLASPPVLSWREPPAAVSGCVALPYQLRQAQGLPVDLRVEVDPDGAEGPAGFRRATQAASELAGVSGLRTSGAGREETFVWDASFDMPAVDADVLLRLTAATDGVSSAPSVTATRVEHGLRMVDQPATGRGLHALQVFDLDRDGWADEVTAIDLGVEVRFGGGGPVETLGLPAAGNDFAAADIDRDGRLDLVVASDGAGLLTFRQVTRRSFDVLASPLGDLQRVTHVLVADGDFDGDDDVFAVQAGDPGVWSFLHDEDGFAAGLQIWTGAVSDMAVGRLFYEGPLSLLLGRGEDPAVSVLEPLTNPTGASPLPSFHGHAVAVGDLDRAGRPDEAFLGVTSLQLLNEDVVANIPVGGTAFVLGDVTGDARTDVVVASPERLFLVENVGLVGDLRFAEPREIAAVAGANHLHLVDRDRDGRVDILFLDGEGRLRWLRNQTARRCNRRLAGPVMTPGTTVKGSSLLVDLGLDGKLDAIHLGGGVHVARGLGDGSFAAFEAVGPAGAGASAEQSVDLEADGAPDLVYSVLPSATLSLQRNDPEQPGQLTLEVLALEDPPLAFRVGQVDADGVNDLVILSASRVQLRRGDPAAPGHFLAGETLPGEVVASSATCAARCQVLVVDFELDGRAEIVVTIGDELRVYEQDPAGGFAEPDVQMLTELGPLISVDVVDDDRPELIAESGGSPVTIAVLAWEQAALVSRWSTTLPAGSRAYRLLAADLDGDGPIELLASITPTCVLRPRTTPSGSLLQLDQCLPFFVTEVAELDGDGRLDLFASGASLTGYTTARSAGRFDAGESLAGLATGSGIAAIGLLSPDGLPDVAALDDDGQGIKVGMQSATLPGTVVVEAESVAGGEGVAILDLDNDLHGDLLAETSGFTLFLEGGNSTPTWFEWCTYAEAFWPVLIADLDGDHREEFIYSDSGAVFVVEPPDLQCALPRQLVASDPAFFLQHFELVDLDLDGRPDLVGADLPIGVAFQSDTRGVFEPTRRVGPPGHRLNEATIVDYDRDGRPDVLGIGNNDLETGLMVLTQQADGSFSDARLLVSTPTAFDFVAADIDGDGRTDVMLDSLVYLQRDDGSGELDLAYATPNVFAGSLGNDGDSRFLDFDQDGKLDLLKISPAAGLVLYRGR